MTDLSKRDVAALLDQWHEVTDLHDCFFVEIQLDTAIRANIDLAAQLGQRDAALDGARLTIARQCLRIAALDAQVKRLREGGPRTRSERIVSALQALRAEGGD
jgi:hypothetical protein